MAVVLDRVPVTMEAIPADLLPAGPFWLEFYADLILLSLYDESKPHRSFLLATYRAGMALQGAVCQFHLARRVGTEKVGIATVSVLPLNQLLVNLYVKPEYRQQGHGKALLRAVQQRYPRVHGVYTASSEALYRALGVPSFPIKAIPRACQVARCNFHARD